MSYHSIAEIQQYCGETNTPFWQAVQLADAEEQGIRPDQSWEKMRHIWSVMQDSIESYDPSMISRSGLVGGEGGLMSAYAQQQSPLCGSFVAQVIARALMMGCSNACMRRIVAAPTAGACGVLPAVLYSCWKELHYSEDEIVRALYVAAGFGQVLADRAYLAGAAGGCQAEIGSASGMAAAALTALRGGTPEQMGHAAAMALKNLMGLVCDPVGGLVEIPCVKRNVVGAVNALSAADMALAGITSAIPVDQVIDTMREVGDALPASLKETAQGGIATTPRAKEICATLGLDLG
jgi:L-serine dehydratase